MNFLPSVLLVRNRRILTRIINDIWNTWFRCIHLEKWKSLKEKKKKERVVKWNSSVFNDRVAPEHTRIPERVSRWIFQARKCEKTSSIPCFIPPRYKISLGRYLITRTIDRLIVPRFRFPETSLFRFTHRCCVFISFILVLLTFVHRHWHGSRAIFSLQRHEGVSVALSPSVMAVFVNIPMSRDRLSPIFSAKQRRIINYTTSLPTMTHCTFIDFVFLRGDGPNRVIFLEFYKRFLSQYVFHVLSVTE